MISDPLLASSWRAHPGSFVGLMTLYESNYIRLGWLAGDLRRLSGVGYSHVAGDCVLKLSVLERGPYTHVFTLTYVFGSDPARYALAEAPNLAIRVYHDARVAEAHAFAESAARTRGGEEALGLEARWSRNMMLNKWLEYCVERGHRFAPERSAMHPPTV